ncbi:MAG: hypothetical protein OHK0032_05690 [Thermodesulfovibrionales bacterium]
MNVQDRIINLLKGLQPGKIYFLAPPDEVKRGFYLYSRHAVRDIRWEDDELLVYVAGEVVTFSEDNATVHITCSCQEENRCVHSICSLLTLKNLLDPSVFRIDMDDMRRDNLLSSLKNEKIPFGSEVVKEEITPSLIFDPDSRNEKLKIQLPEVDKHDHYRIVREIFRLKNDLYKKNLYKRGQISVLLKQGNKEIPLTLTDSLKADIFAGIYYNNFYATMRKAARDTEDNRDLIVIDRFVIDPKRHLFMLVEGTGVWEVLSRLHGQHHLHDDTNIPDKIFLKSNNLYYLSGKKDYLKDLRFISDSGETTPEIIPPGYIIEAKTERGYGNKKVFKLIPLIDTPFGRFNLYPPLLEYLEFILKGRRGLLRKYEKRERILESFFSTILEDKDLKEYKDSLNEIFSDTPRYKRSDLKALLHYLSDIKKMTYPFNNRLIFRGGRWFVLPVDIKREIEFLKVIYTTFGKCLMRSETYSGYAFSVRIPGADFIRELPDLYERASGSGIELSIDKKQLRLSRWEISLSTSHDIDWFELHPEIRVNGKPISEELWLQILEGKTPYIIGKDAIETMDRDTEEIINHIRELVALNKGGKEKEIVRIPRLQIIDWLELRKKGVRLNLPEEEERILNRLLGFERITPKPLPRSLNVKMRPYQVDGYNWLCFLYEHRLGGCLADDMGLGKTIQAISLLTAIKEGLLSSTIKAPHLIVVPPSLLFNWENEIRRFSPQLSVYTYTGSERRVDFDGYDIIITSYGIVRRDVETLKDIRFHVIIFDEAQSVKNIQTDTTSATRRLNGLFKLALTGTPIENHLGEYYSIIDLVLPGLLGEYRDFRRHIKDYNKEAIETIIRRTSPFLLRRTKDEILKELPEKIETEIFLDLIPVQKGIYERTIKEVREEIDDAYKRMRPERAKIVALTALLKLRQICLCPHLLSKELPEEAPKVELLIEQLREVLDEGHSALVFSQFTSFLDIVEGRLKDSDIPYVRLDGSTPVHKRKEIVKNFQTSDSQRVFLLSLKAGGQGLNLTKASYVFHLDPWWNPAVESQATDRAHRIGQIKSVMVTRLLMRHTIEEKMKLLKERKQALYNAILNARTSAKGVQLTREDLDFLLDSEGENQRD